MGTKKGKVEVDNLEKILKKHHEAMREEFAMLVKVLGNRVSVIEQQMRGIRSGFAAREQMAQTVPTMPYADCINRPRAYDPWSNFEENFLDSKLTELARDLALKFGRTEAGITWKMAHTLKRRGYRVF